MVKTTSLQKFRLVAHPSNELEREQICPLCAKDRLSKHPGSKNGKK